MADYPLGVYRTQTCNETISNWKGVNPGNQGGSGAVRVHTVVLNCLATGANSYVTLFNGISASSTATAYITVRCGTVNTGVFDSHAGILFPNGCFITTGAAIDYATVAFRTEFI
jgi:hypothetical protein